MMINVVIHDVDEIKLKCFRFKVVISFKVMINHVRVLNSIEKFFFICHVQTPLHFFFFSKNLFEIATFTFTSTATAPLKKIYIYIYIELLKKRAGRGKVQISLGLTMIDLGFV